MKIDEVVDKLILSALVILITIDGGLWAYVKMAEVYSPQESSLFYRMPTHPRTIPPPTGFSPGIRKVTPAIGASNGWAVRYASSQCQFCVSDEQRWSKLAGQLTSKGYQIITIVPESEASYPVEKLVPQTTQQELYVDVGWLKEFRLSGTPTLLIFNKGHGLIWSHKGTLSIGDPIYAMHEVAYWGKH